MSSFSLKNILRTGMHYAASPLDKRRITLFNYLIFFCVAVSLLLGLVTAIFGLITQPVLCIVAAALLAVSFFLNRKGKIKISKGYFILTGVLIISVTTIVYAEQGLFVDTENMLFVAMAITMFLVDGFRKHTIYWLIFAVYVALKINILNLQGIEPGVVFGMTLINNLVVSAILYLFLYVFRTILIKAFDRSDQHEQTLRSLLDNAPILMALVDRSGHFILVNQNYADRFGYKRRDLIGRSRSEVLPENIFNKHEPMFQDVLKNGKQITFLEETNLPDGSVISANGKYEPILNADGEVESVAICVDDVTELVKAHKALKVANETKDKLFSIIAHDIKSPLNLFHSILNLNHDDVISKEQFMEYQESLKQRLSSLTSTVDELLEWARMQLGGISAYPAKVNISSIVHENADLFHTLIERKQISFKIDTPSEMEAWIDENHFKVAIRNLIHNAIKYTNGGGKVEVTSNQNDQETIVRIVDSGVGMTNETVNSIIKKEIQKSKVGTDQEMGAGLGLSLSLGLLEKNNCNVSVKSEPNKGTQVEIKIPKSAKG
ncbi:PAS domain S-box-containing protein [Ekhidna lutea]|uniref:histidine kinase n=1 Tax=Ekhidna lutea TaxID=447679 RepID=A0A239J2L6_EKHLU|nr:PAS domain-containing sensor histidine kinase [Ekhidna lutea]SNS99912.1 PAS domain S-box-containing protein [Ekhidna lutea]